MATPTPLLPPCPFRRPEGATFTQHDHPIGDGTQFRFTMANGYGASVVRFVMALPTFNVGAGSYGADRGLWELAVLDRHGNIDYSTPITDDVVGYLTDDDVTELLAQIAALPAC